LKVDGRDGRDPQNRENNAPAGRFTCMYAVFYYLGASEIWPDWWEGPDKMGTTV